MADGAHCPRAIEQGWGGGWPLPVPGPQFGADKVTKGKVIRKVATSGKVGNVRSSKAQSYNPPREVQCNEVGEGASWVGGWVGVASPGFRDRILGWRKPPKVMSFGKLQQ